ncbi:uncharacterized protein LOC5501505 [Nematostella vectensis]|uniref:uncharacterized protein LOC5501505 n=1 Tax=Nematostella vectensis TaxID=45351 RepID=UPI0020778C09|nr:uncharacterized protein LOC5501505 [Nematostella vectensis]
MRGCKSLMVWNFLSTVVSLSSSVPDLVSRCSASCRIQAQDKEINTLETAEFYYCFQKCLRGVDGIRRREVHPLVPMASSRHWRNRRSASHNHTNHTHMGCKDIFLSASKYHIIGIPKNIWVDFEKTSMRVNDSDVDHWSSVISWSAVNNSMANNWTHYLVLWMQEGERGYSCRLVAKNQTYLILNSTSEWKYPNSLAVNVSTYPTHSSSYLFNFYANPRDPVKFEIATLPPDDLLDNYYMKIGITERLTDTEKQENRNFLKAVMQTNVFRKMHAFLLASASRLSLTVPSTQSQFEDQLYKIWFYFYNRGAYRDSSGFEHVFVGEKYDDSKSGKKIVKGYHSWLQFYLQEKRRDADYHGYYALSTSEPRGLKLKFDVNNYDKVVSSFFLGTSPEFEFSLYTACFYLRPGQECTCRINSQTIKIRTYTQGRFVGTAFPLFDLNPRYNMVPKLDEVFGAFVLISALLQNAETTDTTCGKVINFSLPIRHKYLSNRVINTFTNTSPVECEQLCFLDNRCLSINFKPHSDHALDQSEEAEEKGECDISYSDHVIHPADMKAVDKANDVLYQRVENSCGCIFPGTRVCHVDFTRNTHRCECTANYTLSSCEAGLAYSQLFCFVSMTTPEALYENVQRYTITVDMRSKSLYGSLRMYPLVTSNMVNNNNYEVVYFRLEDAKRCVQPACVRHGVLTRDSEAVCILGPPPVDAWFTVTLKVTQSSVTVTVKGRFARSFTPRLPLKIMGAVGAVNGFYTIANFRKYSVTVV